MRLFLIRHASYPLAANALGGREEHPLDEHGRAQAEALGHQLSGSSLAAVYSSPQRRARETAAPIAARSRVSLQVDAALAEMDFGNWTGRRFDALSDDLLWGRFNSARSLTRIPDGETMLEAQARLVSFVLRLREAHPGSSAAVVSHADPLRALLCYLLGMPLDLFGRVEIEPAGMVIVELDDWAARILELRRSPAATPLGGSGVALQPGRDQRGDR
jgi:probable phosphoglycerate mutase